MTLALHQAIPAQGNHRRLSRRKAEIQALMTEILETGIYTNGPRVALLERAWQERFGAGAAVGLNSGSSALRAALELLHLPSGSEIIVPAYTFMMTAYAVSDAFTVYPGFQVLHKGGLVPVFVDIDPHTYTIDPQCVREAVTPRTKAILVVHMHGQVADMESLARLAEEQDLYLIEDAAQAHGATYDNPKTGEHLFAGSIGHLGCFSLASVKNVGSMGEDAGLLTLSAQLIEQFPDVVVQAKAWRNTGRMTSHRYLHEQWGIRARMSEYSAAEILAELQYLDSWHNRRQLVAQRYTQALAHSLFRAPRAISGRGHAYFNYMVKAETRPAREHLEQRLGQAGIEVSDPYLVIADQELYRTGALPSRCCPIDVARHISETLVAIPCYPELEEDEIQRIEQVLSQS